MKPIANNTPSQQTPYHSPVIGTVGDVAELTSGPTTVVAEDYGQKSGSRPSAARVDE